MCALQGSGRFGARLGTRKAFPLLLLCFVVWRAMKAGLFRGWATKECCRDHAFLEILVPVLHADGEFCLGAGKAGSVARLEM